MIFEDRWYQTECVKSIWEYFGNGGAGNPLCALPTGTGKSVIISRFCQSVFLRFPGQKILVVTDSKELVAQNYAKAVDMMPGMDIGINSSELGRRDYAQRLIFCGIQSIYKSPEAFGHVDLILIDEAHMVSADDDTMYRKFIKALLAKNPYLKVIGFTATPFRMGSGKLTDEGGLFTDLIYDVTHPEAFARMIAEGFIVPPVPKKAREILDLDGVHIRAGDYKQDELNVAVNKRDVIERCVRESIEGAIDRKRWLFFCTGVEGAVLTADILNEHGIPTVAIHSKMGTSARDDAIKAFKAGAYRCATNNNILTKGFDCPEIDFIGMLRPTMSAALWVQMLGRGTRPAPWVSKLNCLVYDFANNSKKLGTIDQPHTPKKRGKGGGDAPVKDCPVCQRWLPASVRFCGGKTREELIAANELDKGCGHEFVFAIKLQQGASTNALVSGALPEVKEFQVDKVVYGNHQRKGMPPCMRVTYYCGFQVFDEYVCLEHHHNDAIARIARNWWRARLNVKGINDLPITTQQGFGLVEFIPAATHIRVHTNAKIPRVLAHCFDGRAFGTLSEDDRVDEPDIQIDARVARAATAVEAFTSMEDDIPF